MKRIDWKTVKSIAGFLFFVFFISMCTYSINKSDNDAEKICNETEYFKVTNKDYKNTSNTMLSDDYNFVLYFDRYDKNKNLIDCRYDLKHVNITKYEYDNIEVGVMYHKSKVDTRTYGFN